MKLYTEEQVLNALRLAHSHIKPLQYVVDTLKSIELPTDEEIVDMSEEDNDDNLKPSDEFQRGAKWMRDKIQGGNK